MGHMYQDLIPNLLKTKNILSAIATVAGDWSVLFENFLVDGNFIIFIILF